jgi:hypothetical protein
VTDQLHGLPTATYGRCTGCQQPKRVDQNGAIAEHNRYVPLTGAATQIGRCSGGGQRPEQTGVTSQ